MVTVVTTTMFDWMHDYVGNPSNLASEPSNFARSTFPMTFFKRLENVMLSNYIKWAFDRHVRYQDAHVEKAFGPGFPNVNELQRDISLTLVNYHHALNGVRAFTPAVIPVGGIHIFDNDDELPEVCCYIKNYELT